MVEMLKYFGIIFVWSFLSVLATIVCTAPLAFAWVWFVNYVERSY